MVLDAVNTVWFLLGRLTQRGSTGGILIWGEKQMFVFSTKVWGPIRVKENIGYRKKNDLNSKMQIVNLKEIVKVWNTKLE